MAIIRVPSKATPPTRLGKQYRARVEKLIEASDKVEDYSVKHADLIVDLLKQRLLEVARTQAAPQGLEVSGFISTIDREIKHATGDMVILLAKATMQTLKAGILTIDILRSIAPPPALRRAQEEWDEIVEIELEDFPVGAQVQEARRRKKQPAGILTELKRHSKPKVVGGGKKPLPPVKVISNAGEMPLIEIQGVFPVTTPELVERVAAISAQEVTTLFSNYRNKIVTGIQRAALGGLQPLEAMKAVDEALTAPDRGRRLAGGVGTSAERIVRTQLNRVFNKAANDATNNLSKDFALGLVQKEWVTAIDARTRPAHIDAHGQTVLTDKPFIVDGEELMYPGDPQGSPRNVINCRCRAITVLPSSPEELFEL